MLITSILTAIMMQTMREAICAAWNFLIYWYDEKKNHNSYRRRKADIARYSKQTDILINLIKQVMENIILSQQELATSAAVKAVSERVINALNEGEGDPLKVQIFLTAVEKVAKMVKDGIRELCVDAVESRADNAKSMTLAGARIEITETGVKYDYSVIPSWQNVQRKIDALKELQKQIEGKAKFASEQSPYIDCDTETGEQTEIIAIPRTSTTAVKVTIGK